MPDRVHDGTPLTSIDTAWLHMEDPTNLMIVTGLFVLDGPLSVDDVAGTLRERMAEAFPRLRHRVCQRGAGAVWSADQTFDVSAHVHRMGLPGSQGPESLRDVVSDLMSTPLDFTKPLWQCHLIDGVGSGCAVVLRLHHCIGDGMALVHVLLSMTDNVPLVETHAPQAARRFLERHLADGVAWLAGAAASTVVGAVRTAGEIGQLASEGAGVLLHPSRVLDLFRAGAAGARVILDILGRPPDPRTQFKGPLGVAKRAAWSRSFPLEEVKAVGHRLDASVNDVLLSAVAGGLRRYLSQYGRPDRDFEIHALVPVNLRPPEQADDLGNRFGLAYLSLPVGIADRVQRLRRVKARMDEIKSSSEPAVTFQVLGALGHAPRGVSDPLVNLFGSKATAVMTNVVGPRRPIYFCGQRVADLMFWVPQSGRVGLGVSILSYDGRIRVGVATDRGLVPDPERLAQAFDSEFEELVRWAHSPRLVRSSRHPVAQARRRIAR